MVRGTRAYALVVLVLGGIAGCLQPQLTPCGDSFCLDDTTCVDDTHCATADQIAACDGFADSDSCSVEGGTGVCDRGVCVPTGCGNLIVDLGESCDDGNTTSGDGCRADCKKRELCGDAIMDDREGCDDGNVNAADGCDLCVPTTWTATALIGGNANATTTGLARPSGMVMDPDGYLYIADTDNHRIRRMDQTGVLTTVAGTGVPGFSGDGGAATSAQLRNPTRIAVDGLGNLFIADTTNQRIRRVDPTGIITTVAGTGVLGYNGDGKPAISADLNVPSGVAVDGLGNLYIADANNNRVRRVDITGTIETFAGCEPAVCDGLGDGDQATLALLNIPTDVAVDGLGNLYIADATHNRIRRVDETGVITTVAGNGLASFTGDGGPATAAGLTSTRAIGLDAAGNLYIADTTSERIRRVDAITGIIDTIAGTGATGFGGDGGPAVAAQISSPQSIVVDEVGTVYIADSANHRIRQIDLSGVISTAAGSGAVSSSDGGAATSARLTAVVAVAVDNVGNVYLSDTIARKIYRVDTSGVITTVAGTGDFGTSGDGDQATRALLGIATGVAVDGVGNLYFADSYAAYHRIRRVDATTGVITTIAGIPCPSTPCALGDGGPATSAWLDRPRGVALDSLGNLYIADTEHHRIRRIDLTGTITTIAGTGTSGYSGDGGSAISAQIAGPRGIAVDGVGTLYIADTMNSRIRKVTSGGTITTVGGTATLDSPSGVAVDGTGRLYIADTMNHRARRIDSVGVATLAGISPNAGSSGDGRAATAALLSFPEGIAVDALGNIYIADRVNARVRKIDGAGIITTFAGQVDPEGMGPVSGARLADPNALVVTSSLTLVAGGGTGTLQALRANTSELEVVAGRYLAPPTPGLARFAGFQFGTVFGVAHDAPAGLIFFTESSQNRVHVVTMVNPADENTWTIATLASSTGAPGFLDGPAQAAQFRDPRGLYFDAGSRQLYVADTGNHVVRKIDLSSGVAGATVSTVAGIPATLGFFGDGLMATDALLFAPRAITRCANGDLFIADTGNHRVRRVAAGTGLISTVLGVGVAASSGEGHPASTFPVHAPLGLTCDASGNLFVTSTTTVRLIAANANGVVDGTGEVQTIYGGPPRDEFPARATTCLTGLAVVDATTIQVVDSCTGILVQLRRVPK